MELRSKTPRGEPTPQVKPDRMASRVRASLEAGAEAHEILALAGPDKTPREAHGELVALLQRQSAALEVVQYAWETLAAGNPKRFAAQRQRAMAERAAAVAAGAPPRAWHDAMRGLHADLFAIEHDDYFVRSTVRDLATRCGALADQPGLSLAERSMQLQRAKLATLRTLEGRLHYARLDARRASFYTCGALGLLAVGLAAHAAPLTVPVAVMAIAHVWREYAQVRRVVQVQQQVLTLVDAAVERARSESAPATKPPSLGA